MNRALTHPANPQANQVAALLDPSVVAPSWLKSSLGALTADYPPRLPGHAALTQDQRTFAESLRDRLARRLTPASSDEIAAFVVMLQDQFGTGDVDDEALRRRQEGYLLALDGVPSFALDEAFRRIMQGKVPGMSPTFMPRGPELRQLMDEIATPARTYRGNLHRLLIAKMEEPRHPSGPRELPAAVKDIIAGYEGRRRARNPAGVDHADKGGF